MTITFKEAIDLLAAGYKFNLHDKEIFQHGIQVDDATARRLCDDGWLEGCNGNTYWLSDSGKKAYLKSTDEMGNGKLEIKP